MLRQIIGITVLIMIIGSLCLLPQTTSARKWLGFQPEPAPLAKQQEPTGIPVNPPLVEARSFVPNATFTVTNLNNSGTGSLRQAITDANNNGTGADTINFQAGLTGTITLTSSLPQITGALTINGPGANVITVTGGSFTIMSVANGISLTMSGLRMTGGSTSTGLNAAQLEVGGGSATVSNCSFEDSLGGSGAIASFVSLTMTNCAINNSTNTGLINGGAATLTNCTITECSSRGIDESSAPVASTTLTNCTIANNGGNGYIVQLRAGESHTLRLRNTIIANNVDPQIRAVAAGGPALTLTSQGNNLVSDASLTPTATGDLINTNPVLGTVANNGGTTPTCALLPGSPAINAGTATGAPTTDQRGISRVGTTDIGAYEARAFTMAISSGNSQSTAVSTAFGSPLAVTVTSASGDPVNGGTVTFAPPGSGASCTLAGNPATITSGVATTGTVTANATVGGPYTVSASAVGVATGVNFSLTNNAAGTTVSSINRASTNPACVSTSVSWTVTFAASVTGVATSNFSLSGGTGATITGISGSGTTRTVTANTGTAGATLGLNMVNATGVSPTITNLTFTGQTYTVNANPTTAVAGTDQTICSGGATLAANTPTSGTGVWSVVSGPSTSTAQFSSTSSPTATFTPAGGAGAYTLQWTISNSPCTASSDTVVITLASTVVTNGNDSGAGSLRDTIANACAGSTITFQAGVTTVTLTSAELVVDKNLTINGGSGVTVTRSGVIAFRIFNVTSGTVAMNNLAITNGNVTGAGGGIQNGSTLSLTDCTVSGNQGTGQAGGVQNGGTATLTRCTISGNTAPQGGGIQNDDILTMTNCTVSGNTVPNSIGSFGGGLLIFGPTTNLVNCTFTANMATRGGGISAAGTVTLTNTIIALNTGSFNTAIEGTVNAAGSFNNFIQNNGTGGLTNGTNGNILATSNFLLGTLGANGGATQTVPLLPGSPAINAGTATGAPATDQRGISRVGTTDIGAYESRGFTMALASGNNQSTTVTTAFTNPLAVTVTSANGEPVNGGQVTFTPPGSGASCTLAGNPATITGGTATSGTVTANATAGGPYTVAASARGVATGVNFSLTNNPCGTVTVSPTTLPDGVTGTAYSQNLSATGGAGGPFTFAVTAGAVPTSLSLSSAGVLSGTPSVSGTYNFTVTATGVAGCTGNRAYTVNITRQLNASATVTVTGTSSNMTPSTGFIGDFTITTTLRNTSGVTLNGPMYFRVTQLQAGANTYRLKTADDFVAAGPTGGLVNSQQTVVGGALAPNATRTVSFTVGIATVRVPFQLYVDLYAVNGTSPRADKVGSYSFAVNQKFGASGSSFGTKLELEPEAVSETAVIGGIGTQTSPVMAKHPTDVNRFAVAADDYATRNVVVRWTDNGGASWRTQALSRVVNGREYYVANAPALVYTPQGDLVVVYTLGNLEDSANALVVSRLGDRLTFTTPVAIAEYNTTQQKFVARPSLAVNSLGTPYVAWETVDTLNDTSSISVARALGTNLIQATVASGTVSHPVLTVAKDTLYLGWQEWTAKNAGTGGEVRLAVSDNNLSFGPAQTIAATGIGYGRTIPAMPEEEVTANLSLVADPLQTGTLYAVFTQAGDGLDVVLSRSADNGKTWSVPTLVSDVTSGDQFHGVADVGPKGALSIGYRDTRHSLGNETVLVRLAQSGDGGQSFTHSIVSTVPSNDSRSNPNRDTTSNLGTRIGLKVVNGVPVVVWTDTRNGNEDIYLK
ncbi:MAG: hypothetical protein K1Y36_25455 [Blastocatellia bacterium]|nr:hypothetical protein [Blastocatellia bacterium]